MTTTRKKQQVRVTIADPRGRRHSATWKFKSHGGEIYVIAEGLGAEIKTSLHSTGNARHAFVSQANSDRWRKPGSDRAILKWQSRWVASDAPRWQVLVEIIVPESPFRKPNPPSTAAEKDLLVVKAPTLGWSTRLLLIEVPPDDDVPAQIVGKLTIGNRKLEIAAYYEKLTEKNDSELKEVYARIASNIREKERSTQPVRDAAFRCACYLGSSDGIARILDLDVSRLFAPTH